MFQLDLAQRDFPGPFIIGLAANPVNVWRDSVDRRLVTRDLKATGRPA
jgi:hypothetical protein